MCVNAQEAQAWITVAAAAYSVSEAEERKRKQKSINRRMRERAEENAREEHRLRTADVEQQLAAARETAIAEIDRSHVAASRAVGRANVIAGETGSFGSSHQAVLADFFRQESDFELAIQRNLQFQEATSTRDLERARLGLDTSLFNAYLPRQVPQPDYFSAAAAVTQSSYVLGQEWTKPRLKDKEEK
jgi:hypothetical protein